MATMSLVATLECTPEAPRTVKSEVANDVDWTPGQWSGEELKIPKKTKGKEKKPNL